MKQDFAEVCLKAGSIFVHFNPQGDPFECQVPHKFRLKEQVCFQFGKDLPVPIKDLTVSNLGIGGTLSFGGTASWCWVPWQCVFMISPEADPKRAAVWIEDVPQSVRDMAEKNKQRDTAKVVSLADYRAARKKANV